VVRIGIDVGGTFTDLVLYDESTGTLTLEKVASTPDDPAEGIVRGIERALAKSGSDAAAVSFVGHGTTVATNALLERKGAPTALLTTAGFRDLLEIARQKRPSLYDLLATKPAPLVPRHLRFEVRERLLADGTVREPLDLAELERVLDEFEAVAVGEHVEAIAVCFLYSFAAPEHEAAARDRVRRRFPSLPVVASHEVQAEFREYERLSTTVANAYLIPRMAAYVHEFSHRIRELGIRAAPYINQSNGGTMSVEEAATMPVRTALSGPSAGVAGAAWLAGQAGYGDIATFDMGGTSTDVALVRGATPELAFERSIGGIVLRVPTLDIETVGAGGGSIAWRDSGGALLVGPQSAGADPGPACYGRGGEAPTVTDANLFLGRLGSGGLAGGSVGLRADLAAQAIERLARELDLSPLETAYGILRLVNSNMANAVRVVTVRRGVDPRGLALVPFGGAGPLHGSELARDLGMSTIAVPPAPGLLCALGLLVEDLRVDVVKTHLAPLDAALIPILDREFTAMEADALRWLDRESVPTARRHLERWADLRYVGQNFELRVPVPGATWAEGEGELRRRFVQTHEEVYGFAVADEPIQVVNLRLVARGATEPPKLARLPREANGRASGPIATRDVYLDDSSGFVPCPIYDRDQLVAGQRIAGPAVVEQFDSTTWVLPSQEVEVDELGFLLLRSVDEGAEPRLEDTSAISASIQ
jgi:N-methylhydantoinase A